MYHITYFCPVSWRYNLPPPYILFLQCHPSPYIPTSSRIINPIYFSPWTLVYISPQIAFDWQSRLIPPEWLREIQVTTWRNESSKQALLYFRQIEGKPRRKCITSLYTPDFKDNNWIASTVSSQSDYFSTLSPILVWSSLSFKMKGSLSGNWNFQDKSNN